MTYDGISIWKENVLNDFKRFLAFAHGNDNIWIDRRIQHLRAEIERLRNTKNGLIQKLNEASGKLTILTETASTVELNASANNTELSDAVPEKLSDKTYSGDYIWHYLTSPLKIPLGAKFYMLPNLTSPAKNFHGVKDLYVKSIQRWKEKLEFKINKIKDLVDEYTREVEFLVRRKNRPTTENNETERPEGTTTEEQVLLTQGEETATIKQWREPNQGDPYYTVTRVNRGTTNPNSNG